MILFRADGNPVLGAGHIMRCLSVADALKEAGIKAEFVLAEPFMQSLIQSRGYKAHVLNITNLKTWLCQRGSCFKHSFTLTSKNSFHDFKVNSFKVFNHYSISIAVKQICCRIRRSSPQIYFCWTV